MFLFLYNKTYKYLEYNKTFKILILLFKVFLSKSTTKSNKELVL